MKTIAFLAALALAAAAPVSAQQQQQPAPGYGIYAVKIVVKDFDRAIRFYSQLGLHLGPKYNATEWELNWETPGRSSNILMVLDREGRSPRAGGAFLMMQVPDAKAAAAKLRAAGFAGIGEPRLTPQSYILMLQDPDGNQIEMLSPPPAR